MQNSEPCAWKLMSCRDEIATSNHVKSALQHSLRLARAFPRVCSPPHHLHCVLQQTHVVRYESERICTGQLVVMHRQGETVAQHCPHFSRQVLSQHGCKIHEGLREADSLIGSGNPFNCHVTINGRSNYSLDLLQKSSRRAVYGVQEA